ncbi:hypothetical protein CPB85DRAFT_1274101 [Mucidula mucida]|nr:hypothetical protein CPB85DRAFT_1274101 [Mucidula mucida]
MDSREAILDITAERIQELEAKQERLLLEAAEVDRELHLTRAHHGQLLNTQAAISVLPYEILSTIFLLCRDQELSHKKPFELTLSHVSSIWREISLGTGTLWDRIYVRLPPVNISRHAGVFTRKMALFTMYLNRSQNCLLTIRLQVSGGYQWAEVLSVCIPHMWRCRELSLSVTHSIQDMQPAMEKLHSADARQLVRLSVRIAHFHHHLHIQNQFQSITPSIFTAGAPMLNFVRLSGVAGPLQPPLANVTTLHIDGQHMSDLSLDQYRALLESAPQLVSLSLARVTLSSPHTPSARKIPINLAHLRHLRVSGSEDDDEDFSPHLLLAQLPLVLLRSLVLRDVSYFGFDAISFRRVEFLSLTNCSFPSSEFVETVEAFPSLVHLDCDFHVPTILFVLSLESTAESQSEDTRIPPLWPRIDKLTVREILPQHVELVVSSVQARRRRGAPLKVLFLDDTSRQLLHKQKELEDLEKVVSVKDFQLETWPPGISFEEDDDSFWD